MYDLITQPQKLTLNYKLLYTILTQSDYNRHVPHKKSYFVDTQEKLVLAEAAN